MSSYFHLDPYRMVQIPQGCLVYGAVVRHLATYHSGHSQLVGCLFGDETQLQIVLD